MLLCNNYKNFMKILLTVFHILKNCKVVFQKNLNLQQQPFTCSKPTIKIVGNGEKYAQS